MKKLIIGMVVFGLLVGGSVMAVAAENEASAEKTKEYIQKEAPYQNVPEVPPPTKVETSSGTVKGSSDTVKGSSDTVKGSGS